MILESNRGHTKNGQSFSIPNVAQIFQKIETSTHKVSNEIMENQKVTKELMQVKKDWEKKIQ